MEVCDHLVKQFMSEVEFTFHWWRTDFLLDDAMGAAAVGDAAAADFIVVSSSPDREISPGEIIWFESWIAQREGREGAMIDLTETPSAAAGISHRKHYFLRNVAHRAMMDYLTRIPTVGKGQLPDSVQSVGVRAEQVSTLLDNILHQPPPPRMDFSN